MTARASSDKPSLTSTDSFQLRAQRSELRRVWLMALTLVVVLGLTVVRRLMGGVVMSTDALFYPYMGVMLAGIVYQVFVLVNVRSAVREGRIIAGWRWVVSAVVDMGVPVGVLIVAQLHSPRGAMLALTGPPLLLIPLVTLLSILRLKPLFTLWTGLGGAAAHAALAGRALWITGADAEQIPVAMGHAVVLALTGLAAALVSREVKGYVVEGAEEAAGRERDRAALEQVQSDLSVARDIQRGLLPTGKPDLAGFDIAGMNRPADETGGDYYDWQKLSDGRLAVVMADVTGHGIGPALVMAVCRAYARASAAIATDPAALMRRLNDLLHDDLRGGGGRFITLAMALLESSGRVQLVSAGHGPTLLFRASSGEVVVFGGNGLPLAILPNEAYGPSQAFIMERGDVLVLLTDGYFEYQNAAGAQYGIERLSAELQRSAGGSSEGILAALDKSVLAFAAGAAQEDDMTAVVVRRV